MGLWNTTTEYGSMAKALHWLIAIGLFVMIYLGLEQADMEAGDERSRIRILHGSIATVVLGLLSARIIWRWMNEAPAYPEGIARWQRLSSAVVHWGLYLTVFAQLFVGAMMNGTAGRGMPFFGLFSVPVPVPNSRDAHEWWEEVHEFMWIPIAVLITAHVLGAGYNHFIAKNDILRRMTVGIK